MGVSLILSANIMIGWVTLDDEVQVVFQLPIFNGHRYYTYKYILLSH